MHSNTEWKYWGGVDPLYAVASWKGKAIGESHPWTPEQFLELGESDMADVLHHWKNFGILPGRCIEIGCGAGRMTLPLSRAFGSVVALDVSPGQIAKAQELLKEKTPRIDFRVIDIPHIPVEDSTCSGMFSCHVFQHFSSLSGVADYLRETHRCLCDGGTICLHLPVAGAHHGAPESGLLLFCRNLIVKMFRVFGIHKMWEYHRYSARRIISTLKGLGYVDIELRIIPMRSNGDYHSYFFARKQKSSSVAVASPRK